MHGKINSRDWAQQLQAINGAFSERETHLLSEIERLKRELSDTGVRIHALIESEQQLQREVAALQVELHRSEAESILHQEHCQRLNQQHDALKNRIDSMAAEHAAVVQREVTSLQVELQRARAEAAGHQDRLQQLDEHNARLSSQLNATAAERAAVDQHAQAIESALRHAEVRAEESRLAHSHELTSLREGHAIAQRVLVAELERKAEQLEVLADRFASLQSSLEEERRVLGESRERESELHSQLHRAAEAQSGQSRQASELLGTMTSMQAEFLRLAEGHTRQIDALTQSFRLSAEESSRVAQDIESQLRGEMDAMHARFAAVQADHRSMEARLLDITSSWTWRIGAPLRWLAGSSAKAGYREPTTPLATPFNAPSTTVANSVAAASPQASESDAPELLGHSALSSTSTSSPSTTPIMSLDHAPAGAAASIEELLDLHDETFVRCTYLTLLGRTPDPSGFAHYLGMVRRGEAKGAIVANIARSAEARARRIELPGLAQLMRRYPRKFPPVLGRIVRRAFRATTDQLETQLRSSENLMYRMYEAQGARINKVEAALHDLKLQVASQNQVLLSLDRVDRRPSARRRKVLQSEPSVPQRVIYYYVDHTVACPTNTGMQRVARRLADSLVKSGESVVFVKWDAAQRALCRITREEATYLGRWNGPTLSDQTLAEYPAAGDKPTVLDPPVSNKTSWLLVPEVTHITYQAQPMTLPVIEAARRGGLRCAFIFYDATPLRRPELASMSAAHSEYMQNLLLADLVVPISNWVSSDLSSFFRFDQYSVTGSTPYIEPLPLPGESQLSPRVTSAIAMRASVPYILCVGSIVPHKNQLALVHAFDEYCSRNLQTTWNLRLAGNVHETLRDKLAEIASRNPRIQYLGEVDDEQLVRLYSDCTFTAFPSVMEGFGLPILESLWFGKPCLCANFGAMAEVAHGGGCLTVDTGSGTAMYEGLATLIENDALRETLASEARSRPIDTWKDYSARLTEVLRRQSSPLAKLGDIYYWVDHTAKYDGNTGIQRVTRALARALLLLGARLIPVRWSTETRTLVAASAEELHQLAKWNGPDEALWSAWKPLNEISRRDWLLVPELTHFQTREILECGHAVGLRCAWVFYDCIPWKMTDIYPPEATAAHREYMLSLNFAEKVLAISRFSCDDLTNFLTSTDIRVGEVHNRVAPCVLPGEFLESKRVREIKPRVAGRPVKILCVGTVEPRKNHLHLLRALQAAGPQFGNSFELVIAGGAPYAELASQVQALVDSIPGAKWIRRVDDKGLQTLYGDCDFTVYPSIEEGFGLPILESLWNARPCICAEFGAMQEVASGGGCLTVDVRDVDKFAAGIQQLVDDPDLAEELAMEAISRPFKSWSDYGLEVLAQLAEEREHTHVIGTSTSIGSSVELFRAMPNLRPRPLLSLCISTYNRAGWLEVSLRNLQRLLPSPSFDLEILVCDNASTDSTPQVVEPFFNRSDFTYVRNRENVGMLGNLRVTAQRARGQYIWILGDDDLPMPGTVERVLAAIRSNPASSLIYLNYAYTRIDKAEEVHDLDRFLAESTPVGPTGPDEVGTVRDMCAKSENFFTAIYCLVFRRDHALRAYSQNTSGRPFSTMLTCIPTTYHVLHNMMDEPAVWLGQPQLVVNLNVSWMKFAPLWILERLPEAFDVAERYGGDPGQIDRWRANLVPHIQHWLNEILTADPEGNAKYVSIQRLVNRFKHVPEFRAAATSLRDIYERGYESGQQLAAAPADSVFSAFN